MARFENEYTVSDLSREVNEFDEFWTRTVNATQVVYTATADDAKITIYSISEDGEYDRQVRLYFALGSQVVVIGSAVHYPPHTGKA